jgi:hypothetical protein
MIRTGVLAVPKVRLPLGSQSASGKFGNLGVFQGDVVRSLVAPSDPKTVSQVIARALFYDVTKILKAAGPFVRGLLSGMFGSRWYTQAFHFLVGVDNTYWIAAETAWNLKSPNDKLAYINAATFQGSDVSNGEVFFKLLYALHTYMPVGLRDWSLFIRPDSRWPADSYTWWKQAISGVLVSGETESSNVMFIYNGSWNTVSNALAHGGSYQSKVLASAGWIKFYFYGVKFSVKYMKAPGLGTFSMEVDGVSIGGLAENNATQLWQQLYTSVEYNRGIHMVLLNTGAGVEVNLDSVTISNKKTPTSLPVPDVLLDHGATIHRDLDDHPQYHNDTRGDARYPLITVVAADYAPIAKGVTNGDSHDHFAGDGAQIAFSSLSAKREMWPFGVYTHLSPMSTTDSFPYLAAVDRTVTFKKITYSVYVNTTNDASNYWSIILRKSDAPRTVVKTLTTAAVSAGAWVSISATTFDVASATSTDSSVQIRLTKTGSPGSIYMAGPALEVEI